MRRTLVITAIAVSLTCTGLAQAPEPSDSDKIKALLAEVAELKARVAALEARQAAPPKTEPPAAPKPAGAEAAAEGAPAETQAQTQAGSAERGFGIFPGIRISGFGALSYKATAARPPEAGLQGFRNGANNSFAVGDVNLFLTSHLTSKAMVLSEITFSETPEQEFEVDVERLLLKYDFNDYLKISFGRYHTATSYYNAVFHHGQWLQTAADRPLVVEFADHGGLLPSQAVGVSATGQVPSGRFGLNYIVEYGTSNTHRPNILDGTQPDVVENNGQGTTVGLFAKPDWLPGFEIGGSFYHDRISPDNLPVHLEQSIGSAHLVYVTPKFEFLNEGFLIRHQVEETGQIFNTPAFYSLISAKARDKWRPYFRYQYVNSRTPLFPDVGLRHGPSAGIRYDVNDYIALKTQFDRTYRPPLSTFNDLFLQLAFRF